MGNEVSTVGGAIATGATSVAAAVTLGQVDSLNNAAEECAKFTADMASKTLVRHVGETVGAATATAATAVAAGVTFGQVDALNEAVVSCAKHTGKSAVSSAEVAVDTTSDLLDGTPGVGHIKGGIHYACGDREGGDIAMKSASRTAGVVVGATVGIAGGPAGMVACAVAGGAVMDGVTTGVESAIKKEYSPSGSIAAWTAVAKAENGQQAVEGVVLGLSTLTLDMATGASMKGKPGKGQQVPKSNRSLLVKTASRASVAVVSGAAVQVLKSEAELELARAGVRLMSEELHSSESYSESQEKTPLNWSDLSPSSNAELSSSDTISEDSPKKQDSEHSDGAVDGGTPHAEGIYLFERNEDGNYKFGRTCDLKRRQGEHGKSIKPGTWLFWLCSDSKGAENRIKRTEKVKNARIRNDVDKSNTVTEILDSDKITWEEIVKIMNEAI